MGSNGSGMTIATPLRSIFPHRCDRRALCYNTRRHVDVACGHALNRMNFTVSCPQSWQMNVGCARMYWCRW